MTESALILVVNDDLETLRIQRLLLSKAGYTVIEAATGGEGLELARRHRPDLVLLDVVLPDLGGLEVCRRIKADRDLKDTIVVLYSGIQTASNEQVEGLDSGADGYLVLPIPNRELLARVEAVLRIKCAEEGTKRLLYELQVHHSELEAQNQDLRLAQSNLEDSRTKYVDLYDFAPVAYLTLDENGLILEANLTAAEQLGVARNHLINRPLQQYLDREGADSFHLHLKQVLKSRGREKWEVKIPAKDGNDRYVLLDSMFVEDASGKGLYRTSLVDLTERRRTEEALRESEKRFRMLAENLPLGLSLMNEDFTCEYFNPMFTETFGYTLEDLPNRESLLDAFYPDASYRENAVARLRKEVVDPSDAGKPNEAILTTRTKDGKDKTIHLRSVVLGDGRHLVSYQDITEHRQLEGQLRQAQKMEAIGTLAGGIAHDFNNILGIIMAHAEIIGFDIPEDSPAKRNLKEVRNAAYRAKDLVAQILAFSRKGEQERKPMHMIPAVEEALRLLRSSLPKTVEIRRVLDVAPRDDLVLADSTQMQQLLVNLSTNAAHAMRVRGGILEVTLSSIYFGLWDTSKPAELRPGNCLRLRIEDTGMGMDRATLERIFDPYFTTKKPGEGTGLGLAVVHGIIQSHEGAITVCSEPGKGTAFNVYLPALERRAVLEKEDVTAIPGGSETILLADDEGSLLDPMKKIIERLGYRVTATTSSLEALDLFRAQPEQFDLVITDYCMPKMTGINLAREIHEIRPDTRIVLCTGFSDEIDEKKVEGAGIREYILKPLDTRTIARIIRRVLDGDSR